MYQKAEGMAPKKRMEKEAVDLAMAGQWADAVHKNRAILAAYPNDVDSYNRLGRALVEMGNYAEGKDAYNKALELDQHNSIARKNLTRMAALDAAKAALRPKASAGKVAPQIFVGEVGKVGVVQLTNAAPKEVLAKIATGDEVVLKVKGSILVAETAQGEYLGEIEPPHGLRLAKLMRGGNKYSAAISGLPDGEVKVTIKEVFQDPSQGGRLSFPTKATEGYRPHVREALLRADTEEADEMEREPGFEEEEEEEHEALPQGFSFVAGAVPEEEE
ncbi:MAG: tetratricopeptide repeat protein [Chloroflexi bacterium]|nr:tetratricopeptide repeat protein [Chloroflexota bacterium]